MNGGGSIKWDIDADKSNFDRQLTAASAQASAFGSSLTQTGSLAGASFARDLGNSFNTVADGLGKVLKVGAVAGAVLGGGMFLAAKAAFSQVDAVQQATVALRAYEGDAGKVNTVLKDLVSFARSDMGVLFNRKELFASAQNLKIYGDNTENLVGHVKILSRSVGLGLSTWEGLNNVIGRVGSTGRLYADDLQYLQNAGFKLDSSLSGSTQTFETLFAALDKGIPVNALDGQANTIKGLSVKLETAFRGVGEAILGVNSDTGKFVSGGLGETLVGLMNRLRDALKDPALLTSLKALGKNLGDFATTAIPLLISGINWIITNSGLVLSIFAALAAAFVILKVAAIGLGIASSIAFAPMLVPMLAIAVAIAAIVAVLTFLELRFGLVTAAINFFKPVIDLAISSLVAMYTWFAVYILPILQQVAAFVIGQLAQAWANMQAGFNSIVAALSPYISQTQLLQIVLFALLVPFALVVAAVLVFVSVVAIVVAVIARLIGFVTMLIGAYFQLSGAVAGAMAQFVGAVVGGINSAIAAVSRVQSSVVGAFAGAGGWLVGAGKNIVQGLVNGIQGAIGGALKAAADLGASVAKAAKDALQIKSPSKVFAGIGRFVSIGLAEGITSAAGIAVTATSNMANSLSSAMVAEGSASMSMAPSVASDVTGGSSQSNAYHIGTINIASEVDGERWLQKLTRDQEIISNGMIPSR